MMKFKEKRKDYELEIDIKLTSEKINENELNFFSGKTMRGLFGAKYFTRLGTKHIKYTGPIGISLSDRLNKTISEYDFFFIMEEIVDVVQQMKKNSFPLYKMIWDIKHVYINEMTKELQFIYLPIEVTDTEPHLKEFIESIMYSVKSEGDTRYLTEFAYFLNNMKSFNVESIEGFVLSRNPSIVNTIKKQFSGQSGFITDKQKDYYEHYSGDDEATGLLSDYDDEATGLLVEDDEATGLLVEDDEATGLLVEDGQDSYQNVHYPRLHREINNEDIIINKPVFRLGKEKSYVDYFISENNTISRSHADIVTRCGNYFIIDLNSKNKTYVNGEKLSPQSETAIRNGDCIRLSNEEFIFYE